MLAANCQAQGAGPTLSQRQSGCSNSFRVNAHLAEDCLAVFRFTEDIRNGRADQAAGGLLGERLGHRPAQAAQPAVVLHRDVG